MKLNLILGPAKDFNIWGESEWTTFLNSHDAQLHKVEYGQWASLEQLVETVCLKLENGRSRSKFPIFMQMSGSEFCGWYHNELKRLIRELENIIDQLKNINDYRSIAGLAGQTLSDENNPGRPVTPGGEEENNLYGAFRFYLDSLHFYAREALERKKGLMVIPEEVTFNEVGRIYLPGLEIPESGSDGNSIFRKNNGARKAPEQQVRSGANWFYWIAGLSLINSVVNLMGGDMNFAIGLGITQVIDGIVLGTGLIPNYAAFIIDASIAGLFILFGYFAGKKYKWAFITGIILYILDSLIFFAFQDYVSFGFHIFALIWIFQGFRAVYKCEQPDTQAG